MLIKKSIVYFLFLFFSCDFLSDTVNKVIYECLKKGLLLYWLLWEKNAIRISPPLNISNKNIEKGCSIIIEVLNEIDN